MVNQLHIKDINKASEIFGRAYINYPGISYLVPNKELRNKYLKEMFKIELKFRFKCGEVFATSPDLEGIITWVFSDNYKISFLDVIKNGGFSLLFKLGIKTFKRYIKIEEFYTKLHKKHIDSPHWFLGPFCVDPSYQGQGLGKSLLKFLLEKADISKFPIYLYTNTERLFTFYRNNGFELIEKTFFLEGNIPFWGMIKYPNLNSSKEPR